MNGHFTSRRSLLKYGLSTLGAASILPLTAVLDACGTTKSASNAATVTLKMSSSLTTGINSAHWVWYNKFIQLLDARAPERVKIDYYPSSQLGAEADVIKLVRLGTVDMMISGSSSWSAVIPEMSVFDMGYIWPQTLDDIGKALDTSGGGGALSNLMAAQQLEILGWSFSFGWRNVCSKKSVKTPGDLTGLKIRVLPATNFVATLKLMGAVPTPMALGEVYTSLQTGVIDGLESDFPTILANKYYEIARNITLTHHIFNPNITVISHSALNKIPSDLLPTFKQAALDATTYQRMQAASTAANAQTSLEKLGVTIYPIDQSIFKARVQPLWTSFTAKYPDTKPILDTVTSA
jgi:tripartite ATP-independent transporter DctP family solute receptor